MIEYDMSHKQLDYLKRAIENGWGRVSVIPKGEALPLVTCGYLAPIGDTGFVFEITDRGIELLGLDKEKVRANQQITRNPNTWQPAT